VVLVTQQTRMVVVVVVLVALELPQRLAVLVVLVLRRVLAGPL
jgi:hypothetical protein